MKKPIIISDTNTKSLKIKNQIISIFKKKEISKSKVVIVVLNIVVNAQIEMIK